MRSHLHIEKHQENPLPHHLREIFGKVMGELYRHRQQRDTAPALIARKRTDALKPMSDREFIKNQLLGLAQSGKAREDMQHLIQACRDHFRFQACADFKIELENILASQEKGEPNIPSNG